MQKSKRQGIERVQNVIVNLSWDRMRSGWRSRNWLPAIRCDTLRNRNCQPIIRNTGEHTGWAKPDGSVSVAAGFTIQ